jgi:hypothetical protein
VFYIQRKLPAKEKLDHDEVMNSLKEIRERLDLLVQKSRA